MSEVKKVKKIWEIKDNIMKGKTIGSKCGVDFTDGSRVTLKFPKDMTFLLKEGDNVTFKKPWGSYQWGKDGEEKKTYYTTNIEDMEIEVQKQPEKVDWDAKNRLSQRSICLSYANALAVARPEMLTDTVLCIAEAYTKWIYAGHEDQHREEDNENVPF